MRDVISAVLLLGGVSFSLIAGVGLVRLPDVFSRMHAATKPSTLGLVLVLLGAALQMQDGGDVVKLLLVGAFTFVTAPVGAHMIGRSSYRSGVEGLDDLVVDELEDARQDRPDSLER